MILKVIARPANIIGERFSGTELRRGGVRTTVSLTDRFRLLKSFCKCTGMILAFSPNAAGS